MLVTTEQLRVKPDREAELADLLGRLAAAVRDEPGCLEVRLARSAHDPQVFLVVSRYVDGDALDAHTRAPHYTEALPGLMECVEAPPEVAIFDEIPGAAD